MFPLLLSLRKFQGFGELWARNLGGTPPKMELSSGGWSLYRLPPTRWVFLEPICISVPAGIVVRGCVWLYWIFFEDSTALSFHDGWFTSTLAHTTLSVQQFLTKKTAWPPAPPTLFTLIDIFRRRMKKILKGKHFADVEEVNQKMAEALKGIKINEFKNCFE